MFQKLDMEVVLNATLAGGVAVGSASDLVVTAAVAQLIGGAAGIVSAWGFVKLGPWLQEKIGLHDTCGVHNLHGMPGIMGGLIGGLSASMSGSANSFDEASQKATFAAMEDGRTAQEQGMYQIAALGVTLALAIFGGAASGFLVSNCCAPKHLFDDEEHFEAVEYDIPLEDVAGDRKTEAEKPRDTDIN